MTYDFNSIRKEYVNKVKLLFTDIHSLIYEIITNDVYEKFYKDKNEIDFNIYSKNSKVHGKTIKNITSEKKEKADEEVEAEDEDFSIDEIVELKPEIHYYIKKMILDTKGLSYERNCY